MQRPLTLSLVLACTLAACSDADSPLAPGRSQSAILIASEPAPAPSATNYEIRFMQGMIDHHMMAVMTGELCIEKAVHEELRSTCEDIVATQTQEIETMQGWLEDWYGIAYAPEMKPGMMKEVEKLSALEGEEFEIAFMEMMIKHHEGAIREASHCLERASHEELIELCEGIIAAQRAEIEQMQSWLCDWYGMCK